METAPNLINASPTLKNMVNTISGCLFSSFKTLCQDSLNKTHIIRYKCSLCRQNKTYLNILMMPMTNACNLGQYFFSMEFEESSKNIISAGKRFSMKSTKLVTFRGADAEYIIGA